VQLAHDVLGGQRDVLDHLAPVFHRQAVGRIVLVQAQPTAVHQKIAVQREHERGLIEFGHADEARVREGGGHIVITLSQVNEYWAERSICKTWCGCWPQLMK